MSKSTTDGLSLNCKDIVLNQQTTGFWSAKVLELTLTKTLEELVALNQSQHEAILDLTLTAEITASVWYTLVGLKLLVRSVDKKPVWLPYFVNGLLALRHLGFEGNMWTVLDQLEVQLGSASSTQI